MVIYKQRPEFQVGQKVIVLDKKVDRYRSPRTGRRTLNFNSDMSLSVGKTFFVRSVREMLHGYLYDIGNDWEWSHEFLKLVDEPTDNASAIQLLRQEE